VIVILHVISTSSGACNMLITRLITAFTMPFAACRPSVGNMLSSQPRAVRCTCHSDALV